VKETPCHKACFREFNVLPLGLEGQGDFLTTVGFVQQVSGIHTERFADVDQGVYRRRADTVFNLAEKPLRHIRLFSHHLESQLLLFAIFLDQGTEIHFFNPLQTEFTGMVNI